MDLLVLAPALLPWVLLSLWAAHCISRWSADASAPEAPFGGRSLACQALVLVVLLPLPLIDELLAKQQFDALCRGEGTLQAQVRAQMQAVLAAGNPVRLQALAPEQMSGTLVPVLRHPQLYIDASTQQALASFNTLEAQAGKLARLMGRVTHPLTFSGRCGPPPLYVLPATLGHQDGTGNAVGSP
jgi:hypothetical protein